MKRIALLRKNALFVATPNGGKTAAILSDLTSTCRRRDVNPQAYLTQLPANLPDTPVRDLDKWLPDERKKRSGEQPTPTSHRIRPSAAPPRPASRQVRGAIHSADTVDRDWERTMRNIRVL